MAVTFYQHHDYKGYSVSLTPGNYTLNLLKKKHMKNNDLSSMKIENENEGRYTVIFYSDDNFNGSHYRTKRSIQKFRSILWNDRISSIRILEDNPSTASVSNSVLSSNDSNIYNNIRDSIVTILSVTNNSKWTGSGFFIKRNNKYYIVTVAHNVIVSNRNNKINKVVASISNKNKSGVHMAYQCKILGIAGLADIAVLEVLGAITNQTYLNWGNSRTTSPGDTCYILGDPKGVDAISITKGVVRDNKFTFNNSIELLSSDGQIASGNSGSPVVDANGKIIGILSFALGDNNNSMSAGASQQIMEYVVNKIIDRRRDYIGGILDIKAYPVDIVFLEHYNRLPGYLEGYYLTQLNNNTFTYKSMEIISGVKINNKVYKVGVYNNQYPLSSFIYNRPNSNIVLEMKNINTNKIRYETVSVRSISVNDDIPDGNITKNLLKKK